MAWVITGLASGSAPTMYFDLDITETSRNSTQVTWTVTCQAHLGNQTYDYDNYSTTPHISMGGAARIDIGTFGAFGKGAGTRSVSTTYTLNVGTSGGNISWTFSSTQVGGGTSSSSTGYVAGVSSNGSNYPYATASTYATTPSLSGSVTVKDGATTLSSYFRENWGGSSFSLSWPAATNSNGTVHYKLQYSVDNSSSWSDAIGDTTSTSGTHAPGIEFSNIRYRVYGWNSLDSSLTSGWIYSSTLNRNTMNAASLTSSNSVSYVSTSFDLTLGAATDNMGSPMTYSITGINWTTLNGTASTATVNKWVMELYKKSLANSNTIPQMSDISGMTPSYTTLVTDTTSNLVAAAGWTGYDYFISKSTTWVYVSTAKTISVTMNSDDTSRFYLTTPGGTATSVGTVATYNAASTFNVALGAGWNKLEVLQYEGGGGESLTLNVAGSTIASQVTTMDADEAGVLSATTGTFTINTNNAGDTVRTGNYITWANMKAAALAGTTASDSSTYKADFDIQVRATNQYGTTKVTTVSIPLDLGKDAPVSGTPTIAINGSTYTINGGTYYFPKYTPISLTLTANILDALGRKCTQDIIYTSSSVDTVIRNVSAATTSTTANDVDLDMTTTSKTLTFKARAKTYNGVTKDSTPAPSSGTITVHYWAPPTVSTNTLVRTSTAASFGVTVARHTSLTIATANTITLSAVNPTGTWTKASDTGNTTATETFTATSPTLIETDKPTVTVTANDPVGVGLSQAAVSTNTVIPVFVPAFSIRELGVAVNAIPSGVAEFEVGGGIYATEGFVRTGKTTGRSTSTNTWARIATSKITGQYSETNAVIQFMNVGNGAGSTSDHHYAKIAWRVKQQAALGAQPSVALIIFDAHNFVTDNFKAVVTSATTASTTTELWVQVATQYDEIHYQVLESTGTDTARTITWENGNTVQAAISTGTVYSCVGQSNLQLSGYLNINNTAIVNSDNGANGDTTGTNFDHIWHDDSANAWNFCSDTTYRTTGNSKLHAGTIDLDGTMLVGMNGGQFIRLLNKDFATAGGMYNYIGYNDNAGALKGYVGYDSSRNNTLNLYNSLGDVNIQAGAGGIILNAQGTASPHYSITLTGANDNFVNIKPKDANANAGLEIGSTTATTSVYSYIDFHSGGGNNDYDGRIICGGGTSGTIGRGGFTIYGSSFTFSGGNIIGTVQAPSKEEWKENIEEFNHSGLDIINSSKPKKYNYKEQEDKRIGLIAEEAPEEILSLDKDGIDLYSMITVSWKAIQELSDQVKYLENKLKNR